MFVARRLVRPIRKHSHVESQASVQKNEQQQKKKSNQKTPYAHKTPYCGQLVTWAPRVSPGVAEKRG